jgi:dihydrofolate reductase
MPALHRPNSLFTVPGTGMVFKVAAASAAYLQEEWSKLGAIVTGRRDFDVSNAWGGNLILGVPFFIVTHHPPQEWLGDDSPFVFVTEGVETAVSLAQQVAGDKNVGVGGTQIVQQCLQASLIDEIQIELAHMLLGDGIRLLDNLAGYAINLEKIKVVESIRQT